LAIVGIFLAKRFGFAGYDIHIFVVCVDLDDLHGEDGSHDALCISYHGSMGVVGSDVDALLIWFYS
jgi:hypothetical protein